MPEFIDPVFAKTSPRRSFSVIQNECFVLVFVKTGSINAGTGLVLDKLFYREIKSTKMFVTRRFILFKK